jgi:hypothetical protein
LSALDHVNDIVPASSLEDPVMAIQFSCHCGVVEIEAATAPETLTDCNCSICRRYGVLWAYYSPKQVRFVSGEGTTETYMWGDRSIAFHRCRDCGCVTHWQALDPTTDRMGLNGRLMPLEARERTRIRRLDGAVTEEYIDD